MDVGFTGTQHGMTLSQKCEIANWLSKYVEVIDRVHHGCCIGADYEFHQICQWFDLTVVLHPPDNLSKVPGGVFDYFPEELIRDPLPYIDRNHHIVDECSLLIGTPREMKEVRRSGTWATIRYARLSDTERLIITPDGHSTQDHRNDLSTF